MRNESPTPLPLRCVRVSLHSPHRLRTGSLTDPGRGGLVGTRSCGVSRVAASLVRTIVAHEETGTAVRIDSRRQRRCCGALLPITPATRASLPSATVACHGGHASAEPDAALPQCVDARAAVHPPRRRLDRSGLLGDWPLLRQAQGPSIPHALWAQTKSRQRSAHHRLSAEPSVRKKALTFEIEFDNLGLSLKG